MKSYIYCGAIGVVSLLASCSTPQSGNSQGAGSIDNFKMAQTIKSVERNYKCEGANAYFGDSLAVYSTVRVSIDWPTEMGGYNIKVLQDSLLNATFGKPSATIDESLLASVTSPEGSDTFKMLPVDSVPTGDRCMVYLRDVATQLLTVNPLYAVYQVRTSIYDGGAHGMTDTRYVNYDFDHSCVLYFDNLFKSGSDAVLLQAVKDCLMTQFDVSSLAELDAKGVFSDQIFLTHNFYISGDNIVFHYNPYDIAPYSTGAIDVVVPYFQVSECVNGVFAHLFDPTSDDV